MRLTLYQPIDNIICDQIKVKYLLMLHSKIWFVLDLDKISNICFCFRIEHCSGTLGEEGSASW